MNKDKTKIDPLAVIKADNGLVFAYLSGGPLDQMITQLPYLVEDMEMVYLNPSSGEARICAYERIGIFELLTWEFVYVKSYEIERGDPIDNEDWKE